ncbi:MAG: radical SAM protein [Acidimicrobiales bacterium]|nr:radical SAM protein [Acidimicrobiales bacterium]
MHLALTVKATRLCNLRCSYCTDWRAGPGNTMGFEVLANLTHRALSDPAHDLVSFGWHGGDPLVLPVEFFERALDLQARFARTDQRIQNTVQTNATLITPEWIDFLARNGMGVGVSIDGPPEIHDRQRVDRHGHGTFDRVRRGIDALRAAGLPFGTLMTIDRETIELGPERVFEFFLDLGITAYGFNAARPANDHPPSADGPPPHYVDRRTMGRFLIGLHRCWLEHGDPNIHIRELEMIGNRLEGQGMISCRIEGDCVGRYFMVEPDGTVAHCARFQGDERYVFGNVLEHDFATLRRSLRLLERRQEDRRRAEARASCTEYDVCHGGCPHDDLIGRRHDPRHEDGCCGMAELIRHVRGQGARVRIGSAAGDQRG